MSTSVDALILDLLEYVAVQQHTYDDVLEAWHTSCPKLPVWEEANDRGLIARERTNGRAIVRVTAAGAALLKERRVPPHQNGKTG